MSHLLRVLCRECGTSFVSAHPSAIGQLRSQPRGVLRLRECCPHCGAAGTYTVRDYRVGALVGEDRPLETTGGTGPDWWESGAST